MILYPLVKSACRSVLPDFHSARFRDIQQPIWVLLWGVCRAALITLLGWMRNVPNTDLPTVKRGCNNGQASVSPHFAVVASRLRRVSHQITRRWRSLPYWNRFAWQLLGRRSHRLEVIPTAPRFNPEGKSRGVVCGASSIQACCRASIFYHGRWRSSSAVRLLRACLRYSILKVRPLVSYKTSRIACPMIAISYAMAAKPVTGITAGSRYNLVYGVSALYYFS